MIPTLNEERNILWLVDRLPDEPCGVILVDGGSTDRALAVTIDRFALASTSVSVPIGPG